MRINSSELTFLTGSAEILGNMPDVPALPMFSEEMTGFLGALSNEILRVPDVRAYVDVVSYAYWIRKASLEAAKSAHAGYENRIGRGVAFHVAPSNVPVNFAVSMTSAALAGNASVIRVSSKEFKQADIICGAVNRLLDGEFSGLKPYFCIVRYPHSEQITRELSAVCDIRIIWGGDRTVETIRKAPLPPRAIEMTFADRHSIAVINADEYLKADAAEVAKGFYTDTYYTDQNACSSPRLVVWLGKDTAQARERFWSALEELVKRDYEMRPIQAVDKYASFCEFAMCGEGLRLVSDNNYVVRVEADRLTAGMMEHKNGGGYFFEYIADKLEEIVPVLTKQCQTVSVLGVSKEDIRRLVFEKGVRGVDRIVPLGQTMGLEFIWDGYKMIEAMTRYVYSL